MTNRSRSTELIATLISRTPIWTDGTYVLYLHDPKQQLRWLRSVHMKRRSARLIRWYNFSSTTSIAG